MPVMFTGNTGIRATMRFIRRYCQADEGKSLVVA